MTQPSGFGPPKPEKTKRPASEGAKKRASAAKEYEEMKSSGMPEYEIFLRTTMSPQWIPVGVISVRRSDQIHRAIYANEESLMQGAFHRMPILKKNRGNLTFEYGYRLKEYKDEEVQVAVRPAATKLSAIQVALANLTDRITSLFKKPAE
jgi:hypothetical protein